MAVALAGCDPKVPRSSATEAMTDSVPLFKVGKGVWYSDETRKLFGLEMVDVTERPMRRHVEKTAQVYRAAREEKPGAAMVLCSADEAKEITAGQVVSLRVAKGADTEITGKLTQLDAQAHAALGQVEALVEFADPLQVFAAGAFVTATFANGEARPMLAIPGPALLDAADGSYVYTVNGAHLTRTRVKTGPTSEGFIGIEDGLYAGDSVAAKGVENLWLVELSALKGGTPCCAVPKKNPAK